MSPDDPFIPENDEIAGAARRALQRLAGDAALGDNSWPAVQAGARRVRQRRIAAVATASAILLVGAGTVAAVAGSRDQHESISAPSATTSTTAAPTTTTSTTTTTAPAPPCTSGTCGVLGVVGGGTTPTAPAAPTGSVPVAEPGDVQGTLALAQTSMTAGQSTGYFLTLTNITDHAVSFPVYPPLGVWVDGAASDGFVVGDAGAVLAPGEQHTFASVITPAPQSIGPATVSAAILSGANAPDGPCCDIPNFLTGVPSLSATILPPGWVEGQPLDPSQGSWQATLSANTSEVRAGDVVTLSATLQNLADQAAATEGYGSLAIVCTKAPPFGAPYWSTGQFVGVATVQPGAQQTFALDFRFADSDVGNATCSVGLAFHGDADNAAPRKGLDSNSVTIAVLPTPDSSTTTPAPTTTTVP